MIIATTIYTCGPAALATILKTLGIFTTEAELAKLAGNDEEGTILYGLKTASLSKGVNAVGVRLTIDQLQPNYLVVLNIDGTKHFEIVRNITNTTVYLFDPNLGDIEMSWSKFNELYIGVAMIINGTAPANATLLTDDEMRNIKAMWHIAKIEHSYWIPGYVYYTYYKLRVSFSLPYVYLAWVPPYKLWGWIPIPGHFEPRLGWYNINFERTIRIPHYQPPRKVTYYTYEKVYDFNWDRVAAVVSIGGGGFLVGLSVIGDAATGGLGTVPAAYVVYSGITFITVGSTYLMMTWDEPWWK